MALLLLGSATGVAVGLVLSLQDHVHLGNALMLASACSLTKGLVVVGLLQHVWI